MQLHHYPGDVASLRIHAELYCGQLNMIIWDRFYEEGPNTCFFKISNFLIFWKSEMTLHGESEYPSWSCKALKF